MIEDLLNPEAMPDRTETVSLVQTHISLVFIGDDFVYKVKKAVNFGFLDFSTLEKRKHYCHQEIDLNRRLSKDIYLDVLPVTFFKGRYSLKKGPGEEVDYAVKMRRIPEEKLMKYMFQQKTLTIEHLKNVASLLASFHLKTRRTPEIDEFGKPERFRVNTDENFEQVAKYVGQTIEDKKFQTLRAWTNRFYRENERLFYARIHGGKIRDCHGDLHMEHVCFTKEMAVIDCIEFNDRFRYSDTIADLAFLLMDLEYHGGTDFSRILWEEYKTAAAEKDVETLLKFYKVYRAFVRGKVNSFQLEDESISQALKTDAVQKARRYFDLAYAYIS